MYHRLLSAMEPDVFELVQSHWDEGIALWDTPDEVSFADALMSGPWRMRELERFAAQLHQMRSLMEEIA